MDTDTPDLKRIYISPNAPPAPPPGFVADAIPPVSPPPPGVVPNAPGPYTGEAPPPPPGFELDEVGAAQAPTEGSLQPMNAGVIPRYVAHVVQGLEDTVKKPGQIMTANPYPEGSEEHQSFEDSRSQGIAQTAPELASMTLGGGEVPAKPGEMVLGAGPVRKTPPAEAPAPPTGYVLDGTAQSLADDLHAIRQSSVADRAEIGNSIRALPEEAKNPAIGEKLYHAAEDPAEYAKLTPEEKAISDQHLDPLRQEQYDLALEAKSLGGDDLIDDPNFMHRIAKGHAPEYDSISGNAYDPVTGTRGLSRTTSALQERKFYAIEEVPPKTAVSGPQIPSRISVGPTSLQTTPIKSKTLWHETSPENAARLIEDDLSNSIGGSRITNIFVTDNKDIALGQQGKGIKIEYNGDQVSGTEHKKPGAGDLTGREYKTNAIGNSAINSIEVAPGAALRMKPAWQHRLNNDFTKNILPNGVTKYTKKVKIPVGSSAVNNPVRKVITPNDNGISVWNNKTKTDIPTNAEIKPGETINLGGRDWKVVPARTKEIEQHGQFAGNKPAEYHKNAFVNTADAVVHLREVVRNLKFVDQVKKSQWWLNHAVKKGGNARPPKGWVEPKMPQFQGWLVDPKIAHVLDDFYKPGLLGDVPSAQVLREINQFATSSMFWNPIPHMQNVGVHWGVARGFDWVRPSVMRHFATDMTRAIKAVVTQNKDYQHFLREGGGLVYGGVKNADFYGDLGRHMGMQIEKNWGQYKPLFNKLGLKHPYEAVAWWYGKMRNVLWASSDMFMMHRYLELKRKGFSDARAIKDAEKHIPNYRIPAEVGSKLLGERGGRLASMTLQEPAITNFARYHYGMWNSFMNMATDLAKGTRAEKKEALGNVAALAFMGYVIYPVLDALYQKVTGDPNAKMLRRGAMSVPHGLAEVSRDRQSFSQFLGSNITAAPAFKEILQQLFGKDFFTGRDLGGAVPRTEHAAESLVSPYGTAAQLSRGGDEARSVGRTALDTVVGGENTSERTEKGKIYGAVQRGKEARRHEEKPQGPLEGAYYGAKKVLGLGPEPKPEKEVKEKPEKTKRSHHNKEKGY
jgi:hypothetical protein